MTYRRIVLAGAAAALLPMAAQAADMPIQAPIYKAPLYQQPPSWAGWYAGIYAGYGFGSGSFDYSGPLVAAFPGAGLPTSQSPKLDGFLAGAQLGYNWQWGNWVFGPEIDFGYSGIKGTAVATSGVNTLTAEQRINWFGTARARIGYVLWSDWLLYATGGLAFGQIKLDGDLNALAQAAATKWAFGYTFGAGLEYAILRYWTIKGEYLYYDLGSISADYVPAVGLTATGSFKGHMVRAGLNYRF